MKAKAKPAHGTSKAHAVGTNPAIKEANLKRLARIEGQVRGIARMVEEERYCPDILAQVNAAQEALRGVSQALLRNHLEHCAHAAFNQGPRERDAMIEELTQLIALRRRYG
jgi:CsoR family transcriptional regulator, copper-sensing transcriptional repressor